MWLASYLQPLWRTTGCWVWHRGVSTAEGQKDALKTLCYTGLAFALTGQSLTELLGKLRLAGPRTTHPRLSEDPNISDICGHREEGLNREGEQLRQELWPHLS